MDYATVEDVVARFGRALTAGETSQVTEWVADLSSDIRSRIPDVDSRITASPDYGRTVRRVVAETIVWKLNNPRGLRQRTVSIDDYSTTETVDTANSSGRLEISVDDWALLLPGGSGDAFTIRPSGSPGYRLDSRPVIW